jgi:hypothetical protein
LGIIGGLILLSFAVEISIDESNSGKSLQQLLVLPLKVQTQMVCGYGLVFLHLSKYLP